MKFGAKAIFPNFIILLNKQNQCARKYYAKIYCEPQSSLLDEKVRIACKGLRPKSEITLNLNLTSKEDKLNFSSHAHFFTSATGGIDIATAESVGGSYKGVQPMGLFWSMRPQRGYYTRQILKSVWTPFHYTLKVLEGHLDGKEVGENGNERNTLLADLVLEKRLLTSNIKRIEIREGRVRGTMFVPNNACGKFPGVIFLLGGLNRGQIMEDKSALLATKGFATLTLAFYGIDNLPKDFGTLELEYFEEALSIFKQHENVDGDNVGLYGISKGGEILIAMLAKLEGIKAAVLVNTTSNYIYTNLTYKNKSIPSVPLPLHSIREEIIALNKNIVDWSTVVNFPHPANLPEFALSFEKNSADLLIIGSEDDHSFNCMDHLEYMKEKLEKSGKKNYELLKLPGAGHLLDLPNTPLCDYAPHAFLPKKIYLFYGGNVPDHSMATELAWKKIIYFYRSSLC